MRRSRLSLDPPAGFDRALFCRRCDRRPRPRRGHRRQRGRLSDRRRQHHAIPAGLRRTPAPASAARAAGRRRGRTLPRHAHRVIPPWLELSAGPAAARSTSGNAHRRSPRPPAAVPTGERRIDALRWRCRAARRGRPCVWKRSHTRPSHGAHVSPHPVSGYCHVGAGAGTGPVTRRDHHALVQVFLGAMT